MRSSKITKFSIKYYYVKNFFFVQSTIQPISFFVYNYTFYFIPPFFYTSLYVKKFLSQTHFPFLSIISIITLLIMHIVHIKG